MVGCRLVVAGLVAVAVLALVGCGRGSANPPVCDPSYPDTCIFPTPPKLSCTDIPHRNFRVKQPDPHDFDRDRDGIGCDTGDVQ